MTDQREPLDDAMFQQKLVQVRNQPSEKDRLRLLKNIQNNFLVNAEQAVSFSGECHDYDSKTEAAVMFYDVVDDKDAFVKMAVDEIFKYDEDKKAFCDKVGVPVPEKERPKSVDKPKVAKFDQQSVPGYST